jgi:hypothetical protein
MRTAEDGGERRAATPAPARSLPSPAASASRATRRPFVEVIAAAGVSPGRFHSYVAAEDGLLVEVIKGAEGPSPRSSSRSGPRRRRPGSRKRAAGRRVSGSIGSPSGTTRATSSSPSVCGSRTCCRRCGAARQRVARHRPHPPRRPILRRRHRGRRDRRSAVLPRPPRLRPRRGRPRRGAGQRPSGRRVRRDAGRSGLRRSAGRPRRGAAGSPRDGRRLPSSQPSDGSLPRGPVASTGEERAPPGDAAGA